MYQQAVAELARRTGRRVTSVDHIVAAARRRKRGKSSELEWFNLI
jgi:hypothetical protein